jgi:hypothetical protein
MSPLATLEQTVLDRLDVRAVKVHNGMKQTLNKRDVGVAGMDDTDGRDACP